jgi:hypothetical protein
MYQGQKIRFTAEQLGVMRGGESGFVDGEYVRAGDEGTYIGPFGTDNDDVLWHLIAVGDDRVCPATEAMFEPIPA